jgi:hypothetical protein
MAFKVNPITGQLDYYAEGLSISGTDNRVVRMNGVSGIQDSSVTIDDNGTINIPQSQTYQINSVTVARVVEHASGNSVYFGVAGNPGNDTGQLNVAIGVGAGGSLTSGYFNCFIGAGAGASATTQNSCFALGFQAAQNATADGFFALGVNAFRSGTGGSNTAIGNSALKDCTSGDFNTAIGLNALQSLLTGQNNMAAGSFSGGGGRTDQSSNTYVGTSSGSNIGLDAFAATSPTANNTAIGYRAFSGNFGMSFSQEKNVVVGAEAAASVALDQSVLIGYDCASARSSATTESEANVIIGCEAFNGLTTNNTSLTGMVVIGYQAGPSTNPAANVANELWINNAKSDTPLIWGDFADKFVLINRTVKGGSAVTPAHTLEIESSSTIGQATLLIDQEDEDEPFIKFEGDSSATQTKNIDTDDMDGNSASHDVAAPKHSSWDVKAMLRVEILDNTGSVDGDYWIPVYQPV